jgi:hypothetical protein
MTWTRTKTIIAISAGLLLLLVAGSFVTIKSVKQLRQQRQQEQQQRQQARVNDLKNNIWPEERKLEIERIKNRQQTDETANATLIDLKPHINTQLNQATQCWKGNNDNNLSEVPSGRSIFAGVPFEVSGSIQLMGGWMEHYHKTFPDEAKDIRIDRACVKFHLLHGNGYIGPTNFGTVVAKLVVHYVDGSSRDLDLVAGDNAFDWWAPLMKTGLNPRWIQIAAGTERAWTGSNPYIRKWQPELSIVLYRTTFENPQPAVKVASVDYVSTKTITCPFLVGLTVE